MKPQVTKCEKENSLTITDATVNKGWQKADYLKLYLSRDNGSITKIGFKNFGKKGEARYTVATDENEMLKAFAIEILKYV